MVHAPVGVLDANLKSHTKYGESIFGVVSAGFFFIVVGVIAASSPGLYLEVTAFLRDFRIFHVPGVPLVYLPAPASPNGHSAVYAAVVQFDLIWGVFQIFILAFRIVAHTSLGKKAETTGKIAFWLAASYLVTIFLNGTTTVTSWFAYWALVIVLLGVSLIVRAVVIALSPHTGPSP